MSPTDAASSVDAPAEPAASENVPEFVPNLPGVDERSILRQAVDAVPAGVFWKDIDSRFLGANAAFLKLLGESSMDQALGRSDYDYFPPDMAAEFRADDRRVMDTEESLIEFEELVISANGDVDVLHTTKMPLRDNKGNVVGVVGGFRKVTTAIEIEAALVRSQERFALVVEASRDGIWDWDQASGEIELSPRCAELLGLPSSTSKISTSEAFARFGPIQGPEMHRRSAELMLNRSGLIDETAFIDLDDGSRRWVHVVGTPLVRDGFVERIVGSFADITADIERERELKHRASHDSLTGLKNRWAMREKLTRVLREDRPASLLYLDLDQFKIVNDSLGHHVGDEFLAAVAERLRSIVGESAATLSRIGGDEFTVLCVGLAPIDAEELADQIVREFTVPFEIAGVELYTSVSLGVAHIDDRHETALDVMRDADTSLYRAKADGKSCFRVFEPTMRNDADEALSLQNRIRRAVDSMQFTLHYQPVWDPTRNSMVGAEALIRLPSKDGEGPQSPGTFLPFLEQTGLIVQVGEWVIERACQQLAEWRATDPRAEELHVAVNLSQVQFRSEQIVEVISNAISSAGISPTDLVVEVTETAVASDPAVVGAQLQRMRDLGIRVAIDDFGVGQSSLSMLEQLPVDILKIDRSLITPLHGTKAAPVTSCVITLAHALGLVTIAEGIELDEQRQWLEREQCDLMQGYLFARPMPPEEILGYLD